MAPDPSFPFAPIELELTFSDIPVISNLSKFKNMEKDFKEHLKAFKVWQDKIEFTLEQNGIQILDPTTAGTSFFKNSSVGAVGLDSVEVDGNDGIDVNETDNVAGSSSFEKPEDKSLDPEEDSEEEGELVESEKDSQSLLNLSMISDEEIVACVPGEEPLPELVLGTDSANSRKDSDSVSEVEGLGLEALKNRVEDWCGLSAHSLESRTPISKRLEAISRGGVLGNKMKIIPGSASVLRKSSENAVRTLKRPERDWRKDSKEEFDSKLAGMRKGSSWKCASSADGSIETKKLKSMSHRTDQRKGRLHYCLQCTFRFKTEAQLQRHFEYRHAEMAGKCNVGNSPNNSGAFNQMTIALPAPASSVAATDLSSPWELPPQLGISCPGAVISGQAPGTTSTQYKSIVRTQADIYREVHQAYGIFYSDSKEAKFLCLLCGIPFGAEFAVLDHVLRNHKCLYCPEQLTDLFKLQEHMRQCLGLGGDGSQGVGLGGGSYQTSNVGAAVSQ